MTCRCSASMCVPLHKKSRDRSLISDNAADGYQNYKLSVFCKSGDTSSRTIEAHNQIAEGQSISCCTTLSNGISSDGACATTVSPGRVVCLDLSDAEEESPLSRSVNSYNQRKRKQKTAQDKSCNHIDGLSYIDTKSCCQFDSLSISQRIGLTVADSFPDCKPQTQLHGIFEESNKGMSTILSNISAKEELHICCLFCKSPLGLHDNNFLVPCSSASSTKAYLSYLLNHWPSSYSLSKCPSKTPVVDIRIMISDVSSVEGRLLQKCAKQGIQQHDIWCEEDGCVFRPVICPFCTVTCLGVEIKATNAANIDLLNKVIFSPDWYFVYIGGPLGSCHIWLTSITVKVT